MTTASPLIDSTPEERAVLGALIMSNSNAVIYAPQLRQDFFTGDRQTIFQCVQGMVAGGLTVAQDTLIRAAVIRFGEMSSLQMEIVYATTECANVGHIETYISQLHTRYKSREMQRVQASIQDGIGKGVDPMHLIDAMQNQMLRLSLVGTQEKTLPAGDLRIYREQRRAQQAHEADLGKTSPKYGIAGMDHYTRGMMRQRVSILAARPSMGKTVFGLYAAVNAAKQGHHVLFVSLEMAIADIDERLLSIMAGLPMKAITEYQTMTPTQQEKVRQADEALAALPLEFVTRADMSIEDLELLIRKQEQQGKPYDVIVIDYLQILTSRHFDPSKEIEKLRHVATRLRTLSIDCNCHIFGLAQLNRETKRAAKPSMEHIKGSGQFEQDAYSIFILDVDDQEKMDSERRIQLVKNRADGTTAEWIVQVDFSRMWVDNSPFLA